MLGDKEKRSAIGCERSVGEELSASPFADPVGAVVFPLTALQRGYGWEVFTHSFHTTQRSKSIVGVGVCSDLCANLKGLPSLSDLSTKNQACLDLHEATLEKCDGTL